MDAATIALIATLMLLAAVLYSSVSYGEASAHLAIMARFDVAPETMPSERALPSWARLTWPIVGRCRPWAWCWSSPEVN